MKKQSRILYILRIALVLLPVASFVVFGQQPSLLANEAKVRLKLAQCQIQELAFSTNAPAGASALNLVVPMKLFDRAVTLSLTPHSLRGPNFKVLVQRTQGLVQEEAPPPATWRGAIIDQPGSLVCATIEGGTIKGLIRLEDGSLWVVQPLQAAIPGVSPTLHAVFRHQDVLSTPAICRTAAGLPKPPGDSNGVEGGGTGNLVNCYFAQIAFDADVDYYLGTVQATVNQIEGLINSVDAIYARDVQIGYQVTTIIVRTTEPDPYSSTDPSTLLDQFASEWNAHQAGILRDVAHLLTGKDLDGFTSGIAHSGVICSDPAHSYGLSGNQILLPTYDRQVNLMAHELGHNWNAEHCGALDCGIMSEFAPDGPNGFADVSKAQIITYRDSHHNCLTNGLIYVDWNATSPYWGTERNPFLTVIDGANAVPSGGRLLIAGPRRYLENASLNRAMTLNAIGGPVTIGR